MKKSSQNWFARVRHQHTTANNWRTRHTDS